MMPDKTRSDPVVVHPLVLLNITDHVTRFQRQRGAQSAELAHGVVIGNVGPPAEVLNSFELPLADEKDETEKLDLAYIVKKHAQYTQVFRTHEVLGWYAVGAAPTPGHVTIHRQLLQLCDSAVLLLLDAARMTSDASQGDELPVRAFALRGAALEPVPVRLGTSEAEHVAVATAVASGGSAAGAGGGREGLVAFSVAHGGALRVLRQRVGALAAYADAVARGAVNPNPAVLRALQGLCAQLPRAGEPARARLAASIAQERSEALLVAQLAALTRGVAALDDLVERHAALVQATPAATLALCGDMPHAVRRPRATRRQAAGPGFSAGGRRRRRISRGPPRGPAGDDADAESLDGSDGDPALDLFRADAALSRSASFHDPNDGHEDLESLDGSSIGSDSWQA